MNDLNEYQQQMLSFNKYFKIEGDLFEFNCIGMAEEVGEVMGKLKRALRGEGFDRKGYLMELGDLLGYFVLAAKAKDIPLGKVQPLTDRDLDQTSLNLPLLISLNKKLYLRAGKLLEEPVANDRATTLKLLSAVLMYIIQCAESVGSSVDELTELNLQKLKDRLERNGTLLGSGDDR